MTEEEAIYILEIASGKQKEVHIFQNTLKKAIVTVLAHLKFYKEGLEREINKNRENVLEIIQKDRAIEEKDKIIDLMANHIYKREDNTVNIGKFYCLLQDCDNINREVDCDYCIREYFEKQAKEV